MDGPFYHLGMGRSRFGTRCCGPLYFCLPTPIGWTPGGASLAPFPPTLGVALLHYYLPALLLLRLGVVDKHISFETLTSQDSLHLFPLESILSPLSLSLSLSLSHIFRVNFTQTQGAETIAYRAFSLLDRTQK